MKALLLLTTFSLPVCAQLPPTRTLPPARPVPAPRTVPAVPTGTVPAGAETGVAPVNPATGFAPINPAAAPNTLPAPSAGPNSQIGFPPPALSPVTPLAPNTGTDGFGRQNLNVPDVIAFPNGAPPFIGNTVGQNFVVPATNFPPTRVPDFGLPRGPRAQTNAFGVPSPVIPAPGLPPTTTPMNTVGAPSGSEVGRVGPVAAPPIIAPPKAPPLPPPPSRNPGARLPAIRH
jgi:hypothetical protein